MSMTPTDFINQFPEFSDVLPTRIQFWIDKSAVYIDPIAWGTLSDDAIAYWVAHQISFGDQNAQAITDGDEAGAIMKKAGDTAIQFSDKVALARLTGDSYLNTTYGQYFLQLRRTFGAGIFAV